MKISLEALQMLDAIARSGSFAAAALEMGKVPSAVTYSIRKLEEELDVLLYDRRGHRARLTEAGQELLEQGRELLRAANELEQRVKRTATGWEAELKIVIDNIIPFEQIVPLIAEFDQKSCGTRLRITQETLSGVWESLLSGRADIAIGAAYEGSEAARMHGQFQMRPLGEIDWVYAVAAHHPLATAEEPLSAAIIQQHRAVAVGDSGRSLPSITAGLLSGQDRLTVPTMHAKLLSQLSGLGCGHLPRHVALAFLKNGTLIEKKVQDIKLPSTCHYAWRSSHKGKALQWFVQRLSDPVLQARLCGRDMP